MSCKSCDEHRRRVRAAVRRVVNRRNRPKYSPPLYPEPSPKKRRVVI